MLARSASLIMLPDVHGAGAALTVRPQPSRNTWRVMQTLDRRHVFAGQSGGSKITFVVLHNPRDLVMVYC